jgi:hypothetical protein
MLDVPAWLRKEGTLFIRPAYDRQGWGSGVLVRGAAAKELPLVSPGSFIVAAEVEQPGGSILVASIHVCPDKHLAKNMGTLGDVLQPLLDGRRFIVGGDLNSSRHFDAVYKRSTHRTFLGSWRRSGRTTATSRCTAGKSRATGVAARRSIRSITSSWTRPRRRR